MCLGGGFWKKIANKQSFIWESVGQINANGNFVNHFMNAFSFLVSLNIYYLQLHSHIQNQT